MKTILAALLLQKVLAFCNYYDSVGTNINLCDGMQCYSMYDTCNSGCCTGGYCVDQSECKEARIYEWVGISLAILACIVFMALGLVSARKVRKQHDAAYVAHSYKRQQEITEAK